MVIFDNCSFLLATVLPRFEVTLDSPGQLEREEDVQVTVMARYVFGENVQGMVKLNATLVASSRRESLPFHEGTVPLVSVCGVWVWVWVGVGVYRVASNKKVE